MLSFSQHCVITRIQVDKYNLASMDCLCVRKENGEAMIALESLVVLLEVLMK